MEHEQSSVEKFTWKIENFSRLKTDEVCSEPFVLGGYPWRICLFPRGDNVGGDKLSIFLEAVETANMSKGWSRDVKFKLVVFNQLNTNMTITEESNHQFNASDDSWGFEYFMTSAELQDPNKGFIVNDACIVGTKTFVCKVRHENRAASLISRSPRSQTEHTEVEFAGSEPKVQDLNLKTYAPVSPLVFIKSTKNTDAELFSPSIEELMDFSSLGQLDEICSNNPSLTERPSKRSRKYTDLAFAVLGRVLYFLKTRKVKDMNEQACKDLHVLWEELEKFKFDLTWLEPHVQFALGMKSYVEKALQVEKLKENMAILEIETERLKAKLGAAELNLDVERDLLKAKGLDERDLDSELGCGSWRS